jgi:hypothetical protein
MRFATTCLHCWSVSFETSVTWIGLLNVFCRPGRKRRTTRKEWTDFWESFSEQQREAIDPIQRLMSERLIGPPRLDVAVGFPSSTLSISLTIPARLAAAAGKTGMDIDISVYLTQARLAALDAAIARGVVDADADRVKTSSDVFDRLESKLATKTDRR